MLGDEKPVIVRPASLLAPVDLEEARRSAEKECHRQLSDQEFASYLMYPKVFVGFANAQRRYGPVAKLPTLTYFYGMAPGHEIGVEIEQGKTLVIRLTAIGETEEDGTVRLFFELNGQTRVIVVPDRSAAATATARRTADPNNEGHIAAPMPGLVASVAVQQGQPVKAGDLIMTLEAMKMEAGILAPRDAMIAEMVVHAGQTIDAKDLLVVLQ